MHIVGLWSSKKKKSGRNSHLRHHHWCSVRNRSRYCEYLYSPTSTLSSDCLPPQPPCCSQEETDPGCVDTTVSEETGRPWEMTCLAVRFLVWARLHCAHLPPVTLKTTFVSRLRHGARLWYACVHTNQMNQTSGFECIVSVPGCLL